MICLVVLAVVLALAGCSADGCSYESQMLKCHVACEKNGVRRVTYRACECVVPR